MAYTPYVSELILKHAFTTATVTRPTSWVLAMFNDDPEAGGTELSGASYARQSVVFTVADADANDRSEVSNDALVAFPALDAGATVAFIVVMDQAANQLAALALNVPRTLEAGDVFSIPAGELVIKGE